jgi:hypothetical protein
MRNTSAVFLGAAPVALIVALAAWIPARSETSHAPIAPPVTSLPSSPEPEVAPATAVPDPAAHTNIDEKMVTYVLESMQTWNRGPMAGKATHLEEIARDIVTVVTQEPKIWNGSDGSKEAILLARIAWFETRFRNYVLDGSCNKWAAECYAKTKTLNMKVLPEEAQQLMQLGTCDGGMAVSLWQVHFECGSIYLFDDGSWQNACSSASKPHRSVTKADALADHQAAARVALAMARQSVKNTGGLRNYVGGEGPERAGMAAQRFDSAMNWSQKHPYKP